MLVHFNASDETFNNQNPIRTIAVEYLLAIDRQKLLDRITEKISEYKFKEENWNYQDVINYVTSWLTERGVNWCEFVIENIDIDQC